MKLYRPVGLRELELIAEANWSGFPPRLSGQPIFYPVLTFAYAERIAKEWNCPDKDSGYCGFVTTFEVEDGFAARYKVQTVGVADCQELWVPAEELEEFNGHIIGRISVATSYYGDKFEGEVDEATKLPMSVLQLGEIAGRDESNGSK